jgi:hypothetical protein
VSFSSAFQFNAFQVGAFQVAGAGILTDTDILQLPVDCVLAGQQPFTERGRTFEGGPQRMTRRTLGTHSSVRNLSGARPSFTIKTGSRGYD